MLSHSERVQRHAPTLGSLEDEVTQAAVLRWLGVMGEAANRVSPELKAQHPEVPWRRIVNMRYLLVHSYDAVRLDIVWGAIERLPALDEALRRIAESLPES